MSNSKAPKIVVAVALAAVYGTGLAMVTLHDSPDKRAAQNAVVPPATQILEQPAFMTEVPAPVAIATANEPGVSPGEVESVKAEAPGRDLSVVREQAITSVPTGSPAQTSDVEKSGVAAEVATSGDESANSTDDAPSSGEAESASDANDSEIGADVGT